MLIFYIMLLSFESEQGGALAWSDTLWWLVCGGVHYQNLWIQLVQQHTNLLEIFHKLDFVVKNISFFQNFHENLWKIITHNDAKDVSMFLMQGSKPQLAS